MRGLVTLILILIVVSCKRKAGTDISQNEKRNLITANGYIVPAESLTAPIVIPLDEKKIKKIAIGSTIINYTKNNALPAGKPRIYPVLKPEKGFPGENEYTLPTVEHAIVKTIDFGMTETVVAKEISAKDNNPASFQFFSTLHGLKKNQIHQALEDHLGNLWLATGGGLTRYDGKTFTHFTQKSGQGDKSIISLYKDRSNNIWIGTMGGGVIRFNGKSFSTFETKAGIQRDEIWSIMEDKSGNMWFGTWGNGIIRYDGLNLTHYTTKNGLSNNIIIDMVEDVDGNMWFCTYGNGIMKFDGKAFHHYTTATGLINNIVHSCYSDQNGKLYFGTEGGFVKFDGESFTCFTEKEGLINDAVISITKDRFGNFWLGTKNGISEYDGKTFNNYTTSDGITNGWIWNITEDRYGNLWFSTEKGGVNLLKSNPFHHYNIEDVFMNQEVTAIHEDKSGNIWFGCNLGILIKYDGKNFSRFSSTESLSNNYIISIKEDRAGNIWIGTSGAGVIKFDGKSFQCFTSSDGVSSDWVYDIYEDRSGILWFSTYNGVTKFDGKSFSRYSKQQGLSANWVYKIHQDRPGNLWMATNNGGITKYDGKHFTHFTTQNGLPCDKVICVSEDATGNLWFGTGGCGVIRYDGRAFTQFTKAEGLSDNYVNSLWNNPTSDTSGIWIGTDFGLNYADLSRLEQKSIIDQNNNAEKENEKDKILFNSFTNSDGFLGIDCNRNAMLCSNNGTMWAGTNDRVTSLNTKFLSKDTVPPKIELCGIDLFNEKIDWDAFSIKQNEGTSLSKGISLKKISFDSLSSWYRIPKGLSLAYNNNSITFKYIGITLNQPDKVKYKYILEGLDDQRSTLTDRTEAVYGQLPHGNYKFKVKAMNSSGYWSEEYVFAFIIQPPIWKTPLAYGSYVIIFTLLYIGSLRLHSNRLRKRTMLLKSAVDEATAQIRLQREMDFRKLQDENRKSILKTQEDERKRIGRDLHDDLGARLSALKMILQSVYKKEVKGAERLRESSISMLDSAIQDMRGIITNLSPKELKENGYISALKEMIRTISATEKIQFELSTHEMNKRFDPEFENSIFRITQELINNTLKYAEASIISLNLVYRDNKVIFLYEDNGIGFDKKNIKNGYGLNNIRTRAEIYGGEFLIDTSSIKGFQCEVTLYPPVN
jgi:signal transduction histidine kinase/ligand-binding sensor domain-containing protein